MTTQEDERRGARRYLRKAEIAARYGWQSTLSVDRAWKEYKTLPPPTFYRGRFPLWDEAILDQFDADAPRKSNVAVSPELQKKKERSLDKARRRRRIQRVQRSARVAR
jgi:hypothetical protein